MPESAPPEAGIRNDGSPTIVWLILLACLASSVAWFLSATPAERHVVLPAVAMANTAIWFWAILWLRDGAFPIFDVGSVCMAAVACYSLFPFLGFLLSGMKYSPLSARQLYALQPSPEEFGRFAWRYVCYGVAFAIAYCLARGRRPVPSGPLHAVPLRKLAAFALLLGCFHLGFLALAKFYGVDFNAKYEGTSLEAAASSYMGLPVFARQIVHNLQGVRFLLQVGLLVCLFDRWRSPAWRWALVAWIGATVVLGVLTGGQRTTMMLTLVAAALLYDRTVRPVSLKFLVPAGLAALLFFTVLGFIRGQGSFRENLMAFEYLQSVDVPVFSVSNEFQTIFAGSYDLFQMAENGAIGEIPWQVRFNELLMFVPQQLLPFGKVDVQQWYTGLSAHPQYFMYGPVAAAALGWDWVELAFRGGGLGLLLAWMHRWYVRRCDGFWSTLLYLFVILWSYYAIRATPAFIVYSVIFRFIPAFLLVALVERLITRPGGSNPPAAAA